VLELHLHCSRPCGCGSKQEGGGGKVGGREGGGRGSNSVTHHVTCPMHCAPPAMTAIAAMQAPAHNAFAQALACHSGQLRRKHARQLGQKKSPTCCSSASMAS
jgi:hypothetical protein